MRAMIFALTLSVLLIPPAHTQTSASALRAASLEGAGVQDTTAQSPEVAEAQRLSASVVKLYGEGKYDEALPVAKRALEMMEKALGAEHQGMAGVLGNLAELYLAKGKYGDAVPLLQRLLVIHEKYLGPEHLKTAGVLVKLAFARFMKSDLGEAEALYKRALAIREKQLGPDDLEVARSLFELAEYYRLRGQYEKAEPLFQRAINIRGKKLGPEDPEVQRAMDRYSCIYYEKRESDKIEGLRKQFDFFASEANIKKPEIVLNGKAISLPRPQYPKLAQTNRVTGVVVVKVEIDETGKVMSAKDMCGGHPYLRKAAEQSAMNARFTPTLLGGQPVKVQGAITYNFAGR